MTKTKRKVRKVKAKPVRASKTPWERTYPVTRKRASVQAMRAKVTERGVEFEGERKGPYKGGKKVEAKPAKARKPKESESVTPGHIMARERRKRRAAKVMEQPRIKGRFARKPVSEYDMAPKDFYAAQQKKLERGDINADTYARYARNYEKKHPEAKFRRPRYRFTVGIEATKNGEPIYYDIFYEAKTPNLTSRHKADIKDSLETYQEYELRITAMYLLLVVDNYTGKRLRDVR